VQRGAERIDLAPREENHDSQWRADSEIKRAGAPDLVAPLNLRADHRGKPKDLADSFRMENPVQDAVSYTLRISTTAMFTKTVKEARSGERPWKSPGSIPATTSGTSRRRTEKKQTQ